jgi:hypothetical protein
MRPDCSCLDLDKDAEDSCVVCRFFACTGCTYPNAGYCRRHAPTTVSVREHGYTSTHWPMVERSYWCGDFVRREAKP